MLKRVFGNNDKLHAIMHEHHVQEAEAKELKKQQERFLRYKAVQINYTPGKMGSKGHWTSLQTAIVGGKLPGWDYSSGVNNCLYDAVAEQVGVPGQTLRLQAAQFILNNPKVYEDLIPAIKHLKTQGSYGDAALLLGGSKIEYLYAMKEAEPTRQEIRQWVDEHRDELKEAGIDVALLFANPIVGSAAKAFTVAKNSLRAYRATKFGFNLYNKATKGYPIRIVNEDKTPLLLTNNKPVNKPSSNIVFDLDTGQIISKRAFTPPPKSSIMQRQIDNNFGPGYWLDKNYQDHKNLLGDVQKLNYALDKARQFPELKTWKYSDNGSGVKLEKPSINIKESGYDSIRIMKANTDSKYSCQQRDYVVVKYRNNVVDKDGNFIVKSDRGVIYRVRHADAINSKTGELDLNPKKAFEFNVDPSVTKPDHHPDAHISAADWVKWKNWFKPE